MARKNTVFSFFLCAFLCAPLIAQTHSSVSVDSRVYYILEQAELRGLCSPLSGIRPYTQSVVLAAIDEILMFSGERGLNSTEREILQAYSDRFSKPEQGMDWQRGAYYLENNAGGNGVPFSANIGAKAEIEGSSGFDLSGSRYFGTDIWLGLFLNGDLGRNLSYDFTFEGGLIRAPRRYLGTYNTYYEGFPNEDETDDEYANRIIDVYSGPLTHFPYTYKKKWDSSVFPFEKLNSYNSWPEDIAGSYSLPAELTASFFENKLITRLGRISHEWGSVPFGSSLAFNQMARPFIGAEIEFNPVPWFGIASITGALEYHNLKSIKDSAETFQNMFSMTMFQLRYKNYLFFDFIDAVVYPKRFELGYILPVANNFFYQNNVGDFDNMAITMNLKAQYPGLGNIWFSFFVDEMNLLKDLWTLDRQMVAVQAGTSIALPLLSFSSLKLSYTKINPYCYTHNRNFNPWYGNLRMETAYVNNGVSLGYYLPPNSDEILAKFETMPSKNITARLQYQLIRHGADFGSKAVDGGNLLSELDPDGRDSKPVLKRFFLRDGAYQWSHIARIGAEWNIPALPVTLYGEAGVVFSYFTDIEEEKANTGKAYNYSRIDTPEYPESTGFAVKLGIRVFSRN